MKCFNYNTSRKLNLQHVLFTKLIFMLIIFYIVQCKLYITIFCSILNLKKNIINFSFFYLVYFI